MATPREHVDPAGLLPSPAERARLHADAQARLAALRAGDPGHGLVELPDEGEDRPELDGAGPPPYRVLALPGALPDL
jgi:hypothetical protein